MTSPFRSREPIDDAEAIEVLCTGEIEVLGRMPYSSNATFLVDVCDQDRLLQGIYKPHRGEGHLWDFPDGLYRREVAAYELSRELGWDLVPPTVERDGPLGVGSLQLFVPARFDEHYFTLRDDPAHEPWFHRLCIFDVVSNNTDRKSGHCLIDEHDHLWAIDNGLSFHAEYKLRTVVWDWSGDPIPSPLLDDLMAFVERGLPEQLADLLDPFERDATITRANALIRDGRFPVDHTGRSVPWPLV